MISESHNSNLERLPERAETDSFNIVSQKSVKPTENNTRISESRYSYLERLPERAETASFNILSKHWGHQQIWKQLQPLLFWKGDT